MGEILSLFREGRTGTLSGVFSKGIAVLLSACSLALGKSASEPSGAMSVSRAGDTGI